MLDKTLLFLTFATGKQLPFNSPLNNNVGDIFGVLELLQYTTLPNLERNIQIGFVIPIPARTCAIQSRSPLAFPKILWTKGPLTITRWGSDDFYQRCFRWKDIKFSAKIWKEYYSDLIKRWHDWNISSQNHNLNSLWKRNRNLVFFFILCWCM